MINTAVRRAAVLLATLAIPAMLLVASLPASAATSGSLCETNGAYCVNTANFSLYTPATESLTNARTIEAEPQIAPPGTDELVFKGDTSKCLGATKAEIKPCNGGSDIFWIEETSGGSAYWETLGLPRPLAQRCISRVMRTWEANTSWRPRARMARTSSSNSDDGRAHT
jgi:hypothetical protein